MNDEEYEDRKREAKEICTMLGTAASIGFIVTVLPYIAGLLHL